MNIYCIFEQLSFLKLLNVMRVLLFSLFFCGTYIVNSQVFIQKNTSPASTLVTFRYDENEGGNRPSLEIQFKDGFKQFSWVTPVCEGEFSWCLRNTNNEDIAYLKIDVVGNTLVSTYKLDPIFYKQPNSASLKKHIDLLKGSFVRYK
jgi:hypothetical protein